MTVIPPKWGDPFVDKTGVPGRRPQRWIDEVSRIVNTNKNESTPVFVNIGAGASPYAASSNEYIVCDMSSGDIEIQLPSSAAFPIHVARDGDGNVLSVTGSIAKGSPLYINNDNSCAAFFFDSSEYRLC